MRSTLLCGSVVVFLLAAPAGSAADVVLDWNAIALATARNQNPFAQARYVAIAQLAVFEAVNAITGEYEPYVGTITARAGASPAAAAVAAAHKVLVTYFPDRVLALDAAKALSLADIPDGVSKEDGVATGEAAADAMIALRANDGSAFPELYVPVSSAPGEWQTTPACGPFGGGLFYHWGRVTPFGIPSAEAFRASSPPALTSSVYANDYAEVRRVGALSSVERPQDRTDVARFYAVTTGSALWNSAARQVAAAQNRSLSHNAWALALLNIAISDSLVASFETKYFYRLWRPETAIGQGDRDGNEKTEPESGFAPFITTPCFPSYPSAHASSGYAAREVLRRIYGAGEHSIVLANPIVPFTLQYTTFKAITDDIDDARVYGGIHFRFDQEAGGRQGRDIGTYVVKNRLRSVAALQ